MHTPDGQRRVEMVRRGDSRLYRIVQGRASVRDLALWWPGVVISWSMSTAEHAERDRV